MAQAPFCSLTRLLSLLPHSTQNGGKFAMKDLKSAGRQELREHRKAVVDKKKAKKKSASSLKGLTKRDLVEEAEVEYLSALTGQNLRAERPKPAEE